jgi:hypothetical protein
VVGVSVTRVCSLKTTFIRRNSAHFDSDIETFNNIFRTTTETISTIIAETVSTIPIKSNLLKTKQKMNLLHKKIIVTALVIILSFTLCWCLHCWSPLNSAEPYSS